MVNITYLEDLAKELEKEFGLTEKEALEICKLNIDHIYDLVRDPEVISIRFPSLGTLHLNLKRAKFSRVFKVFQDIIKSQADIAQKIVDKQKDQVHGRKSYYSQIRKYFYPNHIERALAKKIDVLTKIESKQNNL